MSTSNPLTVQLGHPKIAEGPFPEVDRVADALAQLFRPEEESVYLFWHGIPVRLRYRQDLPRCFDDILAMVWLVERDESGATEITLETQIVSARWELRWEEGGCRISAAFTERYDAFADYARALGRTPEVRMPRRAFLAEWHTLLHQLVVSIESGGVDVRDGTERRKWEMLQRVDRRIGAYGSLYTRPVGTP